MSSQTVTKAIYSGHDNEAKLFLREPDSTGRKLVPVDLTGFTRLVLIMPDAQPNQLVFDTDLEPTAMTWGVEPGVVELNLQPYDIPVGTYVIGLIGYDEENPNGLVLIDPRPSNLSDLTYVEFRRLYAVGTVPPLNAGMKIPFAYGDASPRVVQSIRTDTLIVAVQVVITTQFDGVGSAIQVVDSLGGVLLDAAQVNPSAVDTYESTPGVVLPEGTDILIQITPGSGATSGAGYLVIHRA